MDGCNGKTCQAVVRLEHDVPCRMNATVVSTSLVGITAHTPKKDAQRRHHTDFAKHVHTISVGSVLYPRSPFTFPVATWALDAPTLSAPPSPVLFLLYTCLRPAPRLHTHLKRYPAIPRFPRRTGTSLRPSTVPCGTSVRAPAMK